MKIISLVTLVLIGAVMTFGQDAPKNQLHATVEIEGAVQNGAVTPQVKTYLTYGGKGKAGLYCWIQNSRNFNQVYCGPTYSPKSWIQVGAAVGAQTGSKTFQSGGFVWVGKKFSNKMVSNLFVAEKGGSWFRNVTSVRATDQLTLSFVTQRYKGTGPRIEYKLSKKASIGAEYFFGKSPTLNVGLKLNF